MHIGGLDGQLAALRHGVARVHCQVHNDLIQVHGVDFNGPIGLQLGGDLDVFADHAAQQFHGWLTISLRSIIFGWLIWRRLKASNWLVSAPPGWRHTGSPPIRPQVRCDSVHPASFTSRYSLDHGEQVIEIVRHSAGQAAHRLQLLRLAELLFKKFPLGESLSMAIAPSMRPAGIAQRGGPDGDINQRAILAAPLALDAGKGVAARKPALHRRNSSR